MSAVAQDAEGIFRVKRVNDERLEELSHLLQAVTREDCSRNDESFQRLQRLAGLRVAVDERTESPMFVVCVSLNVAQVSLKRAFLKTAVLVHREQMGIAFFKREIDGGIQRHRNAHITAAPVHQHTLCHFRRKQTVDITSSCGVVPKIKAVEERRIAGQVFAHLFRGIIKRDNS